MKTFSDLLLNLYRLARHAPPEVFQTRVMNKIREVLWFDSGYWATGVVKPGKGFVAHAYNLYRHLREWLDHYDRINHNDAMTYEAFRQLGKTVNAALCSPEWQARFDPGSLEHLKRFNVSHCLGTIIAEPVLQMWSGVALFRTDPEQPFSERERLFQQNLMPHLSEIWNINRFTFMDSALSHQGQPNHGRAICDIQGVLYNADRDFANLMLAEWPDWKGAQLPPELVRALAGNGPRRHTGCHTVISIETFNNLQLLRARNVSAVDKLTSREIEIAGYFANGMDYRTIASNLHITPATVRNHLQRIYTKLGVASKIELAKVIQNP